MRVGRIFVFDWNVVFRYFYNNGIFICLFVKFEFIIVSEM